MGAEPPIDCVGLEPALAGLVADAARQALGALGLGAVLRAVTICADDLPGAEEAWLSLRREGGDPRPALVLYCDPDVFGPLRPARGTVFPPRAVWERGDPRSVEPPLTAAGFSRARADAFLHHHLQWAADAASGELRIGDVPASLTEAFGACWATTIDGRLSRRGLPGYTLVERRGRFSRLFSTGGILMPGHWKAFQGLWDGEIGRTREVVALARRLPRLQGGNGH